MQMDQPASYRASGQKLLAIDDICERFEDALRGGEPARLEDHLLPSWNQTDQAQLFSYLLPIEIDFRLAQGETVAARDYLTRFPSMAELIERVLPHERSADGPTEIGPYRIVGKLGSGGMGTVYKAFQQQLHRFVAIKILPPGSHGNAAAQRRFELELRSAGKVSHPNIVTAFDAGSTGETKYLVMELVEGFNLSQLTHRAGPIAIANACELARQACLGLAQIHKEGLVHRDLKPANFMLGPDGQVKILDLGLALLREQRSAEGETELTSIGQMMGTFDYMSPEQCEDSHAVDVRSDIYALGATLYYLLVGQAPFAHRQSLTAVGRLSAKLQETPPLLSEFRKDAPAPLVSLVARMLAREPAQRFASATEVAGQLEPLCRAADLNALFESAGHAPAPHSLADTATEGPTVASRQAVPQESARSPISGWIWLGLSLAGFVLAVLAGVIFLNTRNGALRIEINDPRIVAHVVGEKVTLRRADGENEITLSPGMRKLLVERDGFQFETSQFEIVAGGKVTLRVDLLEGEIVVRAGENILGSETIPAPPKKMEPEPDGIVKPVRPAPPLEPIPQPMPGDMPGPNASEEEIAKYLGTIGANAQLEAVGPEKPDEKRIVSLRWAPKTVPRDAQLAPCAQLKHLRTLGFTGGNAGFKLFANCAGITQLELGGSSVDAEGAKVLANFPKLEHVQVACGDLKGFLCEIKNHPSLRSIHIYRCGLAEDSLDDLADMQRLRALWINQNTIDPGLPTQRVVERLSKLHQLETLLLEWHGGPSEADVKKIRAALPKCKVNQ